MQVREDLKTMEHVKKKMEVEKENDEITKEFLIKKMGERMTEIAK